jgi:proteasome lid subunit RPN8/RPN11
VGSEGFEGFVLWSGIMIGLERFEFCSFIVPEQHARLTNNGLLVSVDGTALFEVNRLLHDRGEILAAQVHSHPTEAYHSSTDNTFPLATILGGLSVVIPDFARNAPTDIHKWAWYRLSKRGLWDRASKNTQVEIL